MAGESRTPGIIQATEGVAYPKPWLAQTLNIPLELLDQALEKLEVTKRISMNGACISITNFDYYQGYYQSQEKEEGEKPKRAKVERPLLPKRYQKED